MDHSIPPSAPPQDVGSEPLKANEAAMLPPPTKRRNLYFSAFSVNLSTVAAGCAMTWSSPSIPNMTAAGLIDDNQGSWLTSSLAIGATVGPFLAYRLVDKIGRKTTILLDMGLFVLSWFLLGFADIVASSIPCDVAVSPISVMYVARFLSGCACGCTIMVTPMYIAEISDTYVRSALGSLMQLFFSIGFLMEYCIGPYYSANILTAASTVPPLLCALALIIILPESPLFLLAQNNVHDAQAALRWLRQTDDVHQETQEIQKLLDDARSTELVPWTGMFSKPGHLKCLSHGLALVLFQQLSGINVVLFYAESIFRMTSADISSALCTIVIGLVFMFAASFAPVLTRMFGMKNLLIMSSLTAVVFQGVLASYFILDQEKIDLKMFNWVPITCIILYLITFSVGLGPFPWAVMAEIYIPSIKAKASALSASTCWLITFLLTNLFPSVSQTLGPGACFAVFSGFCVVSSLYTKFLLPDTRGLSLAQIQRMMYGVRHTV